MAVVAQSRRFLQAVILVGPLGFVATEAGWIAAEVGRQPWIITGVMRTADAVTPVPGLLIPLVFFGALYLMLAAVVLWILHHHIGAGTPKELQVMESPAVTRSAYES